MTTRLTRDSLRTQVKNSLHSSFPFRDDDDRNVILENNVIDQASMEALADFTRYISSNKVYEYCLSQGVSKEFTLAIDAVEEKTPRLLDEQPIKTGSVSYGDYVEETHYRINYFNGLITNLTDPSVELTGTIKYSKSRVSFSIAGLDAHKIVRVQVINPGQPAIASTYERWGDVITISSTGTRSQADLPDGVILRIFYKGLFNRIAGLTSAENDEIFDIPKWLDDVLVKGTVAYTLHSRARVLLGLAEFMAGESFDALPTTIDENAASNSFPTTTQRAPIDITNDSFIDDMEDVIERLAGDNDAGTIGNESDDFPSARSDYSEVTDYLSTGDTKITDVNQASRVPENYLTYAEMELNIQASISRNHSEKIAALIAVLNGAITALRAKTELIEANTRQIATLSNDAVGRVGLLQHKDDRSRILNEIASQITRVAEIVYIDGQRKIGEFYQILEDRVQKGEESQVSANVQY